MRTYRYYTHNSKVEGNINVYSKQTNKNEANVRYSLKYDWLKEKKILRKTSTSDKNIFYHAMNGK